MLAFMTIALCLTEPVTVTDGADCPDESVTESAIPDVFKRSVIY